MSVNSASAKANKVYLNRLKSKGMVRVNLVVPVWARANIRAYADTLRRSAGVHMQTPEQIAIESLEAEIKTLKARIEKLING